MGHFHLQRHFEGLDPSRNEKGATKEWCKKTKKKHGVKKEKRKGATEVGESSWALETQEQSVLGGRETKRPHSYVTGVYWVWNPHLSVSPALVCKRKKSGMFSNHISVKSCTWRWPACLMKGAQSVMCWLLNRKLLVIWNTPVAQQFVLPEKSCTQFRGCIIVRSQYFYGWKKVSSTERCTVGKKAFCTPFLMFEIRFKKRSKHWGMFHFPVSCTSIYLPYLVCYILYVHTALQQNVILKIWIWIIKLWSVYDG